MQILHEFFQGHLGLNHLDHIEIGPYSGSEGWTWRVLGAGPNIAGPDPKEAVATARAFQENFDLKKG